MTCATYAVAPSVTNIVARQRTDGSGKVDITYNLWDADSATVYISVAISTNGGSTYSARNYVTGAVGSVRTGSGRRIVWDARADLGASAIFPSCKARITADDSSGGVYPGQMIYIPAGSFLMGNNGSEAGWGDEFPQHSVYLSGYYIGKYEVTRGEYRAFMNAGGYSNSAYWSSAGWSWKVSYNRTEPRYWTAEQYWDEPPGYFWQTDNHPVVDVTYYEAEAFCNWAGGHLPTEAQWERAARWTGSYPNVYPWGNTYYQNKCNDWSDVCHGGFQTAPVGFYYLDGSPSGCHDMAGNVWEWCKDWYLSDYYSQTPVGGWSDPQGPTSGTHHVLRGGGFGNDEFYVRCANRMFLCGGDWGCASYGFRLAR